MSFWRRQSGYRYTQDPMAGTRCWNVRVTVHLDVFIFPKIKEKKEKKFFSFSFFFRFPGSGFSCSFFFIFVTLSVCFFLCKIKLWTELPLDLVVDEHLVLQGEFYRVLPSFTESIETRWHGNQTPEGVSSRNSPKNCNWFDFFKKWKITTTTAAIVWPKKFISLNHFIPKNFLLKKKSSWKSTGKLGNSVDLKWNRENRWRKLAFLEFLLQNRFKKYEKLSDFISFLHDWSFLFRKWEKKRRWRRNGNSVADFHQNRLRKL